MLPSLYLILIFFSSELFAASGAIDVCDYIDLPSCSGINRQSRRSSSSSMPSPATASSINPANVSVDRGFGVETLLQVNNPVSVSLRTGNGKVGGVFLSNAIENSFFGNKTVENNEDYLERVRASHRYKAHKLNLALGLNIVTKKFFGLDAGIIFKRHDHIKKINPGLGVAMRLGIFNFGTSLYYDDFKIGLEDFVNPYSGIPYSQIYGSDTYQEKFLVQTHSVGMRVKNLALDFAYIHSKYRFDTDDTKIFIYSTSYSFKRLLLNAALRKELSPRLQYSNGELIKRRTKTDTYYGLQFLASKAVIIGLNQNYFLLHDWSLNLTIFF